MNKVLDLISNQCESCRLREKCIENECVLYQIEQTILIENKQLKEVIDEVREKLKLERKVALSLNQHYAVSIIDSVLQILDKMQELEVNNDIK